MEKSMVQDLDNMRISLGFKNTFTTSFHDGGYQLKKSKISNLPSYKKSDLSVKLPFIVIFQTMEIQRLSEQIEALRVALKDMQRQAFNCQSYQVQIRQLTDQCHQYDVQLLQYRQQIEKLNMVSQKLYEQLQDWKQKYQNFDPLIIQKFNIKQQQCVNLQNQITKWRDRYRALQKSKDKQLEDLKLAMQSQRKSVLDRQIRDLNLKFEAQRSYLQGQIKKMQEAGQQRDEQLTRVKYQAQTLRIENQVNLDANRKLKQSENKLNKLTQQLVRLNQLLRRKHEEIQRKDANQDYLKQIIKTLQRQKIVQQNEAIKVPQLEGAIKQWIVRFSRLQNEYNESRQRLQRLPVVQKQLQNCTIQIQRLGTVVKGRIHQLNQSNNKAQKYKSLYEQSKKSQQKVPSLERKINEMNYQAQRLNDILKKRLIELEQAKNRILSLQKALRTFQQAQPQRRRVEQQYKRLLRQVQKLKKQISQLQKQNRKIPELEQILTDQRSVREEYTRQVDRLNKTVKDKVDQSQTLKQKINFLENKIQQFENIQTELNEYKNQNNRIVQQLDNINNKMKNKCQQIDQLAELTVKLQRNLQQYKVVEQKLRQNIQNTNKIIDQLNRIKQELEQTEVNLLQCEGELSQAKNTIIDINNEKQIINRNLNLKNQQLQHAKVEINQCLQLIQQLRQVQRSYHDLQQEYRLTQNKLRQTEQQLRKQKCISEQLEYKNQMLLNQLQKIRINGYFPEEFRDAFQQMKINAAQKEKDFENYVKKQTVIQKAVDQIQGMVITICETMKVRNQQWNQINRSIADVVSSVQKIQRLQDEVNSLKVQNLELQSQIKVLNLQMLQSQSKKASQPIQNNFASIPATSGSGKNLGNASASSTSSWSFNTVTSSKKAIDPIVQDQTASRISKILGSSNTINITPINSVKPKLEQTRSSSRVGNENFKFSHINSTSNYNFNMTPSNPSIISSRGVLPNTVSSFVSPSKLSTNILKQSTETYYSSKLTKTNSITQPLTFKSSFRG